MKRLIALLVLLGATTVYAQPVPPGGLRKVTHDTSLAGLGTAGSPLGLLHCVTSGDTIVWNAGSSIWECGSGGGTVTNVDTLAPLAGGPITGSGTISLTLCSAGEILKMNIGGMAWACAADAGGITGSGTANKLMMWTGTGTAGDSPITYDGSSTLSTTKNLSVTGSISHSGLGAGSYALTVTPSARTTSLSGGAQLTLNGTFDTTSGALIGQTAEIDAISTRSTGTNTLTNRALRLTASGAQSNQALVTADGDVTLNSSSGATFLNGNTTVGDSTSDSVTFNAKAASTLDMNSHKVLNLTNGSSAQDAAAFGQIASGINAAVSGTSGKLPKFTATNGIGDSSISDNGTTVSMTEPLDLGTHQIHNVTDGTSAQDAATVAQITALGTSALKTIAPCTLTLSTGNNDDVSLPTCSSNFYYVDLSGTTTLRGIDSTGAVDGQTVFLSFEPGFTLTIANNSSGSTAANRIATNPATTTVINDTSAGAGALEMCSYNTAATRWYCQNLGGNRFASLTVDGVSTLTGALTASGTAHIVGAATLDSTLGTAGNISLGTSSTSPHLIAPNSGQAPITSNCGVSTVTGNDHSGYFTTAAGGITTACAITFRNSYAHPDCIAWYFDSSHNQALIEVLTPSTTTLTFAAKSGALATGLEVHYRCEDH
jgi:hypothetical protein